MPDEDEDAVQFPSRTQQSSGWGSSRAVRNDMEEDQIPFPSRKQGGGGGGFNPLNRPATQ